MLYNVELLGLDFGIKKTKDVKKNPTEIRNKDKTISLDTPKTPNTNPIENANNDNPTKTGKDSK